MPIRVLDFFGIIVGGMNTAMRRTIIFLAMWAMIVPVAAFATSVTGKTEYPDETHYTIKCDTGVPATVKRMHPVNPRRAYSNGWWYVVGGSYFNYPTQEAAVKAACHSPR
jgi:hypothetical protein